MSDSDNIGERKAQHLEICSDESQYEVERGSTLLDKVHFVHRSLPELNEDEIDTGSEFLDHAVAMPLFISSMTGGSEGGYAVNKQLAQVAQRVGIPVGMGSIRILFRKPEVMDHFLLKPFAQDVPVFANIGGVQLRSDELGPLVELLKRLEVDGVAVHLNPGQELVQPEGDRDFRGVLNGIKRLCEVSPVPVIVKETGFGVAVSEVESLVQAGATYVDIAGRGGTNWITVEGYRLTGEAQAVADEFGGWGNPTGPTLAALRDYRGTILASGGIRTGMDVAKALALGAESVGMALPFVRSIREGGIDGGVAFAHRIRQVLRYAMLLCGARTLEELRAAPLVLGSEFRSYTAQLKNIGSR
ncbi:MAG: type 2 isopentenyl-diphosphate Delta-isomerase [Spirochaetales bacterium]